jgi:ABC-type multidrug transport system fused ATPase/permease subunit
MAQLQTGLEQARFHSAIAALALATALALFLLFSLFAVRQQVSFMWPSLPIPLAAASTRRYRRYRRSQSRMWRLKNFYGRAIQRVRGNWVGSGANGEEFNDAGHRYARDLNVFGEGSLFELLCTARTTLGQRGLAEYLLKAPAVEEVLLRQQAIRELRGKVDLRERLAVLGEFEFFDSKWETFTEWLNLPTVPLSTPLRIAALITSSIVAGAIIVGFAGIIPWIGIARWTAPLIAFHAAVGLLFRNRVNKMIAWLRPVSTEIAILREGLQLLEENQFQSPKLIQLTDQVRNSAKSVRKLERLLNALNERNKEMFYMPSLLLLAGTQLFMAIENWRIEHGTTLRVWLEAWAEFEALSALANYAYENPENTFPEFSSGETKFEAEALGHPLLPSPTCVRNDIQLNQDTQFYVISGSNMSGKSTLMRAIGLNAVLAFAGAPVRAGKLRLSQLSVCASLSIIDSLLNGKSKFMAEVDRLRQTIQAAVAGESVLFLIDEIFAGTNSRDRRLAAEAVVKALVNRGAIGALSTHDLALTEIASPEFRGTNVHTGSRDGSDPMDFDYLLKPGITNEANALAIARMAGVPF